jgi:Txe/YoeB family toxin of toxin-antitoxin system
VLEIVDAVMRDPVVGIGKPEPLKHLGPNVWSRRLAAEHRIAYLVRDDRVDFLQRRYPYETHSPWPRTPDWRQGHGRRRWPTPRTSIMTTLGAGLAPAGV